MLSFFFTQTLCYIFNSLIQLNLLKSLLFFTKYISWNFVLWGAIVNDFFKMTYLNILLTTIYMSTYKCN